GVGVLYGRGKQGNSAPESSTEHGTWPTAHWATAGAAEAPGQCRRHLSMRFLIALLALWLLPLPAGAQEPMLLPIHPERLVIDTATGEKSFSFEVAVEHKKKRRGLMVRCSMRDEYGMMLAFVQCGQLGNWIN